MEEPQSPVSPAPIEEMSAESPVLDLQQETSPEQSPTTTQDQPETSAVTESPVVPEEVGTTEDIVETKEETEPIGEVEPDSGKLSDGADVLDSVGNSEPGTPHSPDEAIGSASASASEDEHTHSTKRRRSDVRLQGITPDGGSTYIHSYTPKSILIVSRISTTKYQKSTVFTPHSRVDNYRLC